MKSKKKNSTKEFLCKTGIKSHVWKIHGSWGQGCREIYWGDIEIDIYLLLWGPRESDMTQPVNSCIAHGPYSMNSVMTDMGRGSRKRADVCITDRLRCAAETNTTL